MFFGPGNWIFTILSEFFQSKRVFQGCRVINYANLCQNWPERAKIGILRAKVMLMKPKTTHFLCILGHENILHQQEVIITSKNLFYKKLKSWIMLINAKMTKNGQNTHIRGKYYANETSNHSFSMIFGSGNPIFSILSEYFQSKPNFQGYRVINYAKFMPKSIKKS